MRARRPQLDPQHLRQPLRGTEPARRHAGAAMSEVGCSDGDGGDAFEAHVDAVRAGMPTRQAPVGVRAGLAQGGRSPHGLARFFPAADEGVAQVMGAGTPALTGIDLSADVRRRQQEQAGVGGSAHQVPQRTCVGACTSASASQRASCRIARESVWPSNSSAEATS